MMITKDPLLKVMSILEVLADADNGGFNLLEICERSGLSRSTAHRLLIALTDAGYLERDEGTKTYSLGFSIVRIASSMLNRINIRSIARPYLEELTQETKETAHLGQLDQFRVFYIDISESLHEIGFLSTRIGKHLPLHCTASGKAILAFKSEEFRQHFYEQGELIRKTDNTIITREELEADLELTRQRGYSLDNMENSPENRGIGMPILHRNGEVLAAISVAGPAFRFNPQDKAVIASILRASEQINELVRELIWSVR